VIAAILLLLLGILSTASAANAIWPIRSQWLAFPSFFAAWLTIELAAHTSIVQVGAAALLTWWGALDNPLGWIGLGLLVLGWIGRVVLWSRSRGAAGVVADALAESGYAAPVARVPRKHLMLPFWMHRNGVERIRDIEFSRVAGRVLELDLYRPQTAPDGLPVLVYFHGGAWTVGDKREQALPMLNHLAANGWIAISANYRLSPGASFPDFLVDAKAAIAWVKDHAGNYGGDPRFLAVSGGSAGGHIAALVGLTEDNPIYQPGFEQADTSVQAVVSLYGIYDFTNRLGAQYAGFITRLLEPIVMRDFISDAPDLYRAASPIDQIHSATPPFLVVQGDRDTLAPVEEARAFVAELRKTSRSPVVYFELRGAQHAFDLFYSERTARLVEGVLAFLEGVRAAASERIDPQSAVGERGERTERPT
jgi:acetyl esterase/lipase